MRLRPQRLAGPLLRIQLGAQLQVLVFGAPDDLAEDSIQLELAVTVIPLLVLMNDDAVLGEHCNGWISNIALGALSVLSVAVLVAAFPLQILGGG